MRTISTLIIGLSLIIPSIASASTIKVVPHNEKLHLVERYEDKSIVQDIERVQKSQRITKAYCATLPKNVGEGDPSEQDVLDCRNFVTRVDTNYSQVGRFVDQFYCIISFGTSSRCASKVQANLQTAH